MNLTNTSEIKFKSGLVIPVGTVLEVKFQEGASICELTVPDGRVAKLRLLSLVRLFNRFKVPSLKTCGKWMDDGIARSMLGNKVEPDGHDSEGSPSWLLVMGLI